MNNGIVTVEQFFPKIETEDGIAYGGCQEWYPVEMKRWAGCASVAGANLASFYESKITGIVQFRQSDYLERMDDMYAYMTPGHRGFPNPYVFKDRFVQYQKDRGYDFESQIFSSWKSVDEAEWWIADTLSDGDLVTVLILHHKAEVIQENTWHWMSVPFVDTETHTMAFSTYGVREVYNVADILEPDPENEVWMIRFRDRSGE